MACARFPDTKGWVTTLSRHLGMEEHTYFSQMGTPFQEVWVSRTSPQILFVFSNREKNDLISDQILRHDYEKNQCTACLCSPRGAFES